MLCEPGPTAHLGMESGPSFKQTELPKTKRQFDPNKAWPLVGPDPHALDTWITINCY